MLAGAGTGAGLVWARVEFRHIAFDTPLDATPRPHEPVTPALEHFHRTGENLYARQPEAIADGKRLYEAWCQGCHMPDGSGRIGPSLVGEQRLYPRTATDLGLFEAVYGGALGAMQAFAGRLTQDEILRVAAYVQSLRRRTAGAGTP